MATVQAGQGWWKVNETTQESVCSHGIEKNNDLVECIECKIKKQLDDIAKNVIERSCNGCKRNVQESGFEYCKKCIRSFKDYHTNSGLHI